MEKVIANLQPVGYDSPIENTVGEYKVTGSIRVSREKKLESMEGTVLNGNGEYAGRFTLNGGPAIVGTDSDRRGILNMNDVLVDSQSYVVEAITATLGKVMDELATPEE